MNAIQDTFVISIMSDRLSNNNKDPNYRLPRKDQDLFKWLDDFASTVRDEKSPSRIDYWVAITSKHIHEDFF